MPIRSLAAICIHFAQQYSVAWFPLILFWVGSRVIHNGAIGELAEQNNDKVKYYAPSFELNPHNNGISGLLVS
jgi:hypothetical protein